MQNVETSKKCKKQSRAHPIWSSIKFMRFLIAISLFLLSACDQPPTFLPEFTCPAGNFALPVSLQNTANRGYLQSPGGKLFYWLVPAAQNAASAPVVLWMNGGPGSSSLLGMWFENGPYFLNRDMTTYANPYSWNANANIIYIDQPAGTGFSNTSDVKGVPASEDEIATNLNAALEDFFANVHPELQTNKFFIFGESFAGTYIPWLASKVIDAQRLNLKGIGIGDGTINDLVNFQTTAAYALQNGLIVQSQADYLNSDVFPRCQREIEESIASSTTNYPQSCGEIYNYVADSALNINFYDVRGFANYDLRGLGCYLNNAAIKTSLGIASGDSWGENNSQILNARAGDAIYTTTPLIKKALTNNIRVLIYHGEKDLLINHIGAETWLNSEFGLTGLIDWHIGDKLVGQNASSGLLSYSLIFNAGHLVPYDQPQASLQMFEQFVLF